MTKEEMIEDFMNYLNQDIQHKDFLTYQEQDEWKDYINRIINNQVKEKNKEIERLNNIIKEFDKWLLGENMMFYKSDDGERLIRYGETKNKWLEWKEGK